MSNELKPCPFCGSKPEQYDNEYACCTGSKCQMSNMVIDNRVWNTRVQPSDGALTNEGAEPIWTWMTPDGVCGWTDRWDIAKHLPYELTKLYRHSPKVCTCPSGDGSLRWPCPVHPPEPTAVAWECDDSAGETGRVLFTNDTAVRDEWVRQELPVCPLFGPASTDSRS